MKFKGKKRLFSIALGMLLLVMLDLIYSNYITGLLTSESKMHLSEVATQGASSVQRQIDRDFDLLEILADGIVSNPEIPLEDKLERIKKQADKFNLYRIGIVDKNGTARTSDGHEFSVKDRKFFREAIQGRAYLSKPLTDKVGGKKQGIVYAVPIYYQGKITGVLFSGYELKALTQRIDVSFYHKSGLAFITDSKGTVLLHPIEKRVGRNIIEIAKTRNKAAKVMEFQTDLQLGRRGVSRLVMKEDERFFAYAPIKGTDNWNLVTSLPARVVFERSRKVISLTIILMVIVFFVFLTATVFIRRMKKKSTKQIRKMAYYDALTGALNIEGFKGEAEQLFGEAGTGAYSLLNFDVKQFRYFNNELGYGMGNDFLVHIAYCLAAKAEKGETFARVSADQFLFLFYSKQNEEETKRYIEQICTTITQWEKICRGYYSVQMACGVYEMQDKEEEIMSCIEKSNIARKAAKNCYESQVIFYSDQMQERMEFEKELEQRMPQALKNGEFRLFIQPKYDLTSEKIVGGEALVRWIREDQTMVMPDEFIPLFEQTGAIYQMDLYMLEQLCDFIHGLTDSGRRPVPISINQSRRYMYQAGYLEGIMKILNEKNILPEMIELEITENMVYTDMDQLTGVISVLHKEGFRISLDDFGSGYSSLNVLKDLLVDTLKLDRIMLSETLNSERGKTVVANVIRMAKELKMSVVAEGVETGEQVIFLRECGCETGQGYYYSKPVPADKFQQLLDLSTGID
ncbi:MAG: GGDEF domain-containing protein [Lachnospiraceae bacterium]